MTDKAATRRRRPSGRRASPDARLKRPVESREWSGRAARYLIRFGALAYLALVLVGPVGYVFYKAFEHGIGPAWDAVTTPAALHALWLTLEIAAIAVPANTIFGVVAAIAIVRYRFPGAGLVNALVDLPLALSPVVVGLSLLLLYGTGGWLEGHGILFAMPAMVLATTFVSLPFVVREVVPVLREVGTEQEQAASTLGASGVQTFRRVTWPAIRWATAFGIVLTTARALGEFGAVSVVSGRLVGQTETLTLHVQERYESFDTTGAYAAAVVLALIALATLILMNLLKPKEETR